jgi:DNA-binding NarL/FixJ family response regulator
MTLVLSDDHPIVRSGVRELLQGSAFSVVGEATTPQETLQAVASHTPDLLLIDIRLAGGDAFDVLKEVKQQMPEVRIVVLSGFANPTYIARSLILGVDDYLLKDCSRESLIEALEAAAGKADLPANSLLRAAAKSLYHVANGCREQLKLTDREWQVLRHLALGLSNSEIACSLNIAVHTVKEHVQRVLRKLQLKHRTEAGVWATRQGLVNGTLYDTPADSELETSLQDG